MYKQQKRRLKAAGILAAIASLVCAAPAQMPMAMCHPAGQEDSGSPDRLPAPLRLSGIGNVRFPISANAAAQAWFEQGINLLYDFWDYEADRAFEEAIRSDPTCAMCYWGLYRSEDFSRGDTAKYAKEALEKAVALEKHASSRERLYIQAAQAQEDARRPPGSEKNASPGGQVPILRKLVHKKPHDTNARIALAEALTDGYDDKGQPGKGQKEALALLSGVLQEQPDNSAANHLWIHAVEAGPHPEDALHSAEILGSLAPTSGHMVHMPGHIFYRTGEYARAQRAFDASTVADESYMRTQHVAPDHDWNYVHNLMYSVANLLEQGRLREAVEVSAKLTAAHGHTQDSLYLWSARDSISRLNPELPIALRTGDWPRVSRLLEGAVIPNSLPHLEFLAGSLSQFALGMQAVEEREPDLAERHSVLLDASMWRMSQQIKNESGAKHQGPQSLDSFPEPLVALLSIMSLELRGSILATQSQVAEAEKLFASARKEEKDLGYHEPPYYIRPVGETEAAALMAAGKWAEAKTAYQQALLQRPHSGFPLYGLALAAEKSGDAAGSVTAYQNFLAAWKTADANLPQLAHAQQWLAQHSGAGAVTASR